MKACMKNILLSIITILLGGTVVAGKEYVPLSQRFQVKQGLIRENIPLHLEEEHRAKITAYAVKRYSKEPAHLEAIASSPKAGSPSPKSRRGIPPLAGEDFASPEGGDASDESE